MDSNILALDIVLIFFTSSATSGPFCRIKVLKTFTAQVDDDEDDSWGFVVSERRKSRRFQFKN